ncbi:MAG: hypothetical protein ACLFQV_06215 [Vulcanimicrobiota bacterium]
MKKVIGLLIVFACLILVSEAIAAPTAVLKKKKDQQSNNLLEATDLSSEDEGVVLADSESGDTKDKKKKTG